MLTLEDCKSHAAECLRLAKTAVSPEQKAILSDLAREWEFLARRMEGLETVQPGDETKKSA